jgi:NADH-quinone oxidoreductase subunit M
MAMTTASLLLVAVPVVGATLGMLMWRNPQALKVWLLIVTIATFVTVGLTSAALSQVNGGALLRSLLPLTAFVTLLAQPAHRSLRAAWLMTLLLLGLGLGVLAWAAPLAQVFFLLLLALIGLMLYRYRHQAVFDAWAGIGTAGLGILCIVVAMTVPPPVSSIMLAVACGIGLPLVPFHQSYVAALTGLPGNLPAFLGVLLPVVGFHGLLTVQPELSDTVFNAVGILSLVGMVYGSLKALTQSRAASVMTYGSLAFFSIAWWYLITTRIAVPETLVYVSAVALATSGLLIARYVLRARYGEIDLRALTGLSERMPRFAVALLLLTVAALGLPPFGVFSGFIGMLLAPSLTLSGGLAVILIVWLCASWYFLDLAHGLLFGRQRHERHHVDLHAPELASLAIILALLVALGVMPARLFNPGPANLQRTVWMEPPAWIK